jgi:hypothetical protein
MANSITASRGILLSGAKTVTTAGTAEALASSGLYASVAIKAKNGNTGQVYVGGSDVASSTNGGLSPGDRLVIAPSRGHIVDLSDTYIDVDTNGEGVDIYALV